jgi:uncharacterized protein YndB with AHSA1/START domain
VTLLKGFISAVALGLLAFVGVGFALDGTWRVTRTVELDAPPEQVFPYVNELEGWDRWTPWDHVEATPSGPPAGPGAARHWDDPQWGQGEWTLTESDPPHRVAYEVRVEGGSLRTQGEIRLTRLGSARTRVEWTESGDFGWNPFLGYMALGMDRMQGREMEKNLATLRSVVEGGRP